MQHVKLTRVSNFDQSEQRKCFRTSQAFSWNFFFIFSTDFFIAGIDIILAAILIFINYTSKDLESQQRIYEETKHFSDEFSFDDVANANYTRAVITECFRLCPSAFAVARFTEEDMDFSGYRVKAGVS